MVPLAETRERFLLAILAQVSAERIAEIHFFAPIRQGGVESGVAVVAAWPETVGSPEPEVAEPVDRPVESIDEPTSAEGLESAEMVQGLETSDQPEIANDAEVSGPSGVEDAPPVRHVVYTARYRHTLKGPDRGKWETNIVAEADAPLVTVDAVVRGVQRRAGDVDEPTRMDGTDVRAFAESLQITAQG